MVLGRFDLCFNFRIRSIILRQFLIQIALFPQELLTFQPNNVEMSSCVFELFGYAIEFFFRFRFVLSRLMPILKQFLQVGLNMANRFFQFFLKLSVFFQPAFQVGCFADQFFKLYLLGQNSRPVSIATTDHHPLGGDNFTRFGDNGSSGAVPVPNL